MLYTRSARRSRQFYDFSLSKLELDLVDPELYSNSEYETLRLKLKKSQSFKHSVNNGTFCITVKPQRVTSQKVPL